MTFKKCEIQNKITECVQACTRTHTKHTIQAVKHLYSCSEKGHQPWKLRNTVMTDYALLTCVVYVNVNTYSRSHLVFSDMFKC